MNERRYRDPDLPKGQEERRVNQRREQCEYHEDRDKVIIKSGKAIARHSGQWTILMWGMGLLSGVILVIGGVMYTTANSTNALVIQMDKTFTAYMTSHIQESQEGFRRIKLNEVGIKVNFDHIGIHEKRLDRIESYELGHRENSK